MRKFHCLATVLIGLVSASAAPSTVLAQADIVTIWNARFSTFRGRADCQYGSPNCNRCVNDVEQQFNTVTRSSNVTKRVRSWTWEDRQYPPSNLLPRAILPDTPLGAWGHWQGFVRMNDSPSGEPRIAGSMEESGGRGGVFFSKGSPNQAGLTSSSFLTHLYESTFSHPGGMQAIGDYVLVASDDETNGAWPKLEIGKMSNATLTASAHNLPGLDRAANVAVAQLAGGGYLLMNNRSSGDNDYRLFYTPSLDQPNFEQVYAQKVGADSIPEGNSENGYENISMVTECGSQKIFVIAVSGGTFPGPQDGHWNLFELVPGTATVLKYVSKNSNDMAFAECDPRAAGSAFAGKNGELALYCHQKTRARDDRQIVASCFFTGILPLIGTAFCNRVNNLPQESWFTEYWPNVSSNYTVSVTVGGSWQGLAGGTVGVLDAESGMICESAAGVPVTCNWSVPAGQGITFVPFQGDGWDFSLWQGACSDRNVNSQAVDCTKTVNGNLQVTLSANKLG